MNDHRAHRALSVIGAPSSAGAYGPGQEHAPVVFRRLIPSLKSRGIDVVDHGDGAVAHWRTDEANPTAARSSWSTT
jgi:arginase